MTRATCPLGIRSADLFAGFGGFTTGAIQAGAGVVLAVNHDALAVRWHEENHPGVEHWCQDIAELDWRAVPRVELLLASPECQGFTPSGRTGRTNPVTPAKLRRDGRRLRARNTSYSVLAAADVMRPRSIIVENVVEFLDWEAFPAWRAMLEAHGYSVTSHRIRADRYGAATVRERAIIVAHQGQPIHLESTWGSRSRAIGDCLLADDDPACRWGPIIRKTPSIQRRMRSVQRRHGSRVTWANVDSARGRREDEHFATFTTRSLSQLHLIDGDQCRRLEARELARAMGFPDSHALPVSRTLAGRLIGNAIACDVARGVVEQVMPVAFPTRGAA